jgi:hypothetical protein
MLVGSLSGLKVQERQNQNHYRRRDPILICCLFLALLSQSNLIMNSII